MQCDIIYWCGRLTCWGRVIEIATNRQLNDKPALVQIMAWCRTGCKPYMNQWWPCLLYMWATQSRWIRAFIYISRGICQTRAAIIHISLLQHPNRPLCKCAQDIWKNNICKNVIVANVQFRGVPSQQLFRSGLLELLRGLVRGFILSRSHYDDIMYREYFPRYWPAWGKSAGQRWIPLTKSRDAKLWYFFNLCRNKRLNKQPRRRWFERLSHSLWRHSNCNVFFAS